MNGDGTLTLLASILRDAPAGLPPGRRVGPELRDAVEIHAIGPLLAWKLRGTGYPEWLEPYQADIEAIAAREAILAERRRVEAARVVRALGEEGVDSLILKGVALGHVLYARPGLRPCLDIDLLVPPKDRDAARRALGRIGYVLRRTGIGEENLVGRDEGGMGHQVDLHWELSASVVRARDFPFDELASRRIPVQAIGPGAFTLSTVDALVLAALHFAHHCGRERLIWIWDVHLLAEAIGAAEWRELEERARVKRIRTVCSRVLALGADRFGSQAAREGAGRLFLNGRLIWLREPSACFVAPSHRMLLESFAKLRNADGWRVRAEHLRRLFVPPRESMRERFGDSFDRSPVRLYGARLLRGTLRYGLLGWTGARDAARPAEPARLSPRTARFASWPAKAFLALRAAFWLVTVPLLVAFLDLERVLTVLTPTRPGRSLPADEAHALASARGGFLDSLLRLRPGSRAPRCWKRALVIYRLLQASGLEAEVLFGVRLVAGGNLEGHAWVVFGGLSWDAPKPGTYRVTLAWPSGRKEGNR